MNDCMTFPDTVEEFMEQYKVVDAEHIYTNGSEFVPIFRMKQWFEHLPSEQSEPEAISKWKKEFREYVDSLDIARDDWKGIIEYIDELPSAQPTLYGYNIGHLELIARVLQKEDLPPERVVEALTDIGRIVAIVSDEFEETLRKAVEQCTT